MDTKEKPATGQVAGSEPLKLDVDKVLREKAKGIYHLIPGFIIRYLKRIVHQDEMNEALVRLHGLKGLDLVGHVMTREFNPEIEVINPENIPAEGRFIVVANHPLGGLDGMALMHLIGRKRPDLKFISNDILTEIEPLRDLFVEVNKHGRNSREVVRLIEKAYASDDLLLIFPAGLVSRRQGRIIADLEWKSSFVPRAVKHRRDVVPVYIEGRNSEFFYNLAKWRKRLGIATNLEMLYLPDEMFRQKDKKIVVHFGKAIPYTFFTADRKPSEWARYMRSHVYGLAGRQVPPL